MNIDKDLLLAWGGRQKKYKKDEIIFMEDEKAEMYTQIIEGNVKMYNINDNAGKEFTQGVFHSGNSFGEPPVFLNEVYPATAVATSDSLIMLLPRESFLRILHDYPDIHMRFTEIMARRTYNKAITLKELMSNTPATRILGFLNSYKKGLQASVEKIQIPFTRQEIANFTGLRVETVIRVLHKMHENHQVEIRDRKLFY